MTQTRVSAPQFFSLLYLSVLSSIFMYISSPEITVSETDSLLRPLIFIVISIIAGIPTFLIYKEINKSESLKTTLTESKLFKVVAAFYGVVYFIGIIRTAARFDLFASSELFPGTEMTLFIIALIVVCALISLLGLGALSRAGVIFVVIVVGATGFVMLSLLEEVDLLNFTPLFREGGLNFIWDSVLFGVQASEIGAIALVLPEIKGNVTKNYILWSVFSGLSFIVVLFFVVGTLGVFADTQLFPTYTAVTLAKFGLLERMDALETAIWILCVVEKIAFYFLVISKSFKIVFKKVSKRLICIVSAVLVSIVLAFISSNLERFSFISYTPVVLAMYIVPVIVLPLATVIYLKKVKPCEKNSETD